MKKTLIGWRDAIGAKARARLAKVSRFFNAQYAAFKALSIWKKAAIISAAVILVAVLWWCL